MKEQVHLYPKHLNKTTSMDAMLSTMFYQQRAARSTRLLARSTVLRGASNGTIYNEAFKVASGEVAHLLAQ